jgi:hypothetical protein
MVSPVSPSHRLSGRRRPAPRRTGRAFAAVVAAAAIGIGGWLLWSHLQAHRVKVVFGGLPAADLELTFFPDRLAFAAPSPPPALGRLVLAAAATTTLGADLVPDRAVVRYAAAGIGTGYRHLALGAPPVTIALRAPAAARGRVVEPVAAWSYGWRCAAERPVADAEVVVMGGGEHGVELARARSAADGSFVVAGFDGELDGLGLRVRAPGFALGHLSLRRSGAATSADLVVPLAPARPQRGRIVVPPGLDPTGWRLLARGLPGVECAPAADGSFLLDHVPDGVQPRLLLYGLPAAWTHQPIRLGPDLRIELVAAATVRGRIVDAVTRAPLGGALVFCGDDHAVRADADGRFELVQLPPGPATIDAKFEYREGRRRLSRTASRPVQLRAGAVLDDVTIPID